MRKSARNLGFTLIELIVTVAVITALAAMTIPGLGNYLEGQNLSQSLEQVKSDTRTVQNRALTGTLSSDPNVGYWAVWFAGGNATYGYYTFTPAGTLHEGHGSNEGLVGDIVVRENKIILFEEFSGNAYNTGATPEPCEQTGSNCTIVIGEPGATGNNCSSISVNTAGAIFTQENVPCP